MEEMRRKDREVTELETVKEIIRQCDVLRLGLADGDYPYIVPMNFGWEEKEGRLYFYLHGAAEGRKAELLRQNGACSFQMDCGHRVVQLPGHGITTRYGCVMGKATVTPLTEEEKPQACGLQKSWGGAMEETAVIKVIAEIRSDFPTKFGIPRQSGLVPELEALVVFRPEYRVPEALRGIEGYSHLWLLWEFSETKREGWRPTVRQAAGGGAPSRMGHGAAGSRG